MALDFNAAGVVLGFAGNVVEYIPVGSSLVRSTTLETGLRDGADFNLLPPHPHEKVDCPFLLSAKSREFSRDLITVGMPHISEAVVSTHIKPITVR